MSQLAILIAIYCVKGGQSPWAEILQKCPYHFSLVSSHFPHVQVVRQPCKWGKDKSATCGEGQPWMADLSCRSLWGVAISYSLCFIIITKAEAILAASDAMNICARSFKTIFITKCCSGSSYPGSMYYHHDLSNHLQIYCVSKALGEMWKGYFGGCCGYQNSMSQLEILLARASILCTYFHVWHRELILFLTRDLLSNSCVHLNFYFSIFKCLCIM